LCCGWWVSGKVEREESFSCLFDSQPGVELVKLNQPDGWTHTKMGCENAPVRPIYDVNLARYKKTHGEKYFHSCDSLIARVKTPSNPSRRTVIERYQ
jgi:hypothetical protein